MGMQEEDKGAAMANKKQKTSKEVYFSILPDKYEPLVEQEEDGREESPEERRKRKEEKRRRRKKLRKNVRKAFCFGWRCVVAGLQSMASAYSMPMLAVASVATKTEQAAASSASRA